jgi:hypothetical protein
MRKKVAKNKGALVKIGIIIGQGTGRRLADIFRDFVKK